MNRPRGVDKEDPFDLGSGKNRVPHTEMGCWQVIVRAWLRRLVCPAHEVQVEAVPFARYRSSLSHDFEDLTLFTGTQDRQDGHQPAPKGRLGLLAQSASDRLTCGVHALITEGPTHQQRLIVDETSAAQHAH